MEMREKVSAALKGAMKAKDTERLGTLRLINAAIKDRDIALRGADGEGQCEAKDITAILAKMVKQRRESAAVYEEGGRLELAQKELAEIDVIEEFLPRQLTEAEAARAVDEAVAETGATSIRDMGKVMGALKARYAGRMDFAATGPMVKDRLGG